MPQRVELSFLVGASRPSVVVEEPGGLRRPPTIRETDERYRAITQDVMGRIWWTRRMSTVLGFGWSNRESRSYTFPRPQSPPSFPPTFPFTHYEAERTVSYRNRLFAVSQAWDLTAGRVVPFVAGGVEFRSVVREQNSVSVGYSDPESRTSSTNERSGYQISVLAATGVRLLAGRRGIVLVDGSLFLKDTERGVGPGGILFANQKQANTLLGSITGRWRVGAGVRF